LGLGRSEVKKINIQSDYITMEIKKNISILDVADEFGLKLKRSGKSYFTSCPFHGEKTPSCSLVPNADSTKDFFNCFGCEAGGDQINFFAKLNNMSYGQAKSLLAKRFGLSENNPLTEPLIREYAKNKRDRTVERNFLKAYKQVYYELCSVRDMMNNLGSQYDMEPFCIEDRMYLLLEDDLLVIYYQEKDSHEVLIENLRDGIEHLRAQIENPRVEIFEEISYDEQIETFRKAKELVKKWEEPLQKRLINII
jgi:hypothetical protein